MGVSIPAGFYVKLSLVHFLCATPPVQVFDISCPFTCKLRSFHQVRLSVCQPVSQNSTRLPDRAKWKRHQTRVTHRCAKLQISCCTQESSFHGFRTHTQRPNFNYWKTYYNGAIETIRLYVSALHGMAWVQFSADLWSFATHRKSFHA